MGQETWTGDVPYCFHENFRSFAIYFLCETFFRKKNLATFHLALNFFASLPDCKLVDYISD